MSIRIYGKRLIQTPPGANTRPTASKVRESIFNIWHSHLEGARWLDLCAGSGAMGAEALARGAVEVVGIELNGAACRIIQSNWEKIAVSSQRYKVIRGDVRTALTQLKGPFDLIYFDPPYHANLYLSVLERVANHRLLSTTGLIAAEHDQDLALPKAIATLKSFRYCQYGQTALTFYKHAVPSSEE